jgi:hypothetical protein
MLSFELYSINNEKIQGNNIISYELSKDINAPCDGLRLNFYSTSLLPEIVRVCAFCDGKIIFNGFADTQRETFNENGQYVFIYARSSACLLVDNQAVPYTYTKPTALSLFYDYANDFGFSYALPKIKCDYDYRVGSGYSCYTAINELVYTVTGKNIVVTENNELKVPSGSNIVSLANCQIISCKRTINRGNALSQIDYKIESSDSYSYHIKSKTLENNQINRCKKINLSSYPKWQREYKAINTLKSYANDYYTVELVINSSCIFNLYDLVNYCDERLGDLDNYIIGEIVYSFDDNGDKTTLVLYKQPDLKEINYVAE